jgi:endonuclease YncB( thermonuclease family)
MFPSVHTSSRLHSGAAHLVPWIFILGVVLGVLIANRGWLAGDAFRAPTRIEERGEQDQAWQRLTLPGARHAITVLRIIDGDTFLGRVQLWPGIEMTTRVRLRGIDAPEMSASCTQERRMAEESTEALKKLLSTGDVTIFNIGPDKYAGRVVADVSTGRIANVSGALLESGHARRYEGGRRESWCPAGVR